MTSEPTSAPEAPQPRPRRRARWPLWTALAFAILLLAAILVVAGAYLGRRNLGRDIAVDWLRERGVEAQIDVEQLDVDGFTGRLRIGPKDDPEVVVDRVEVKYRVLGFWNGQPLGVEVADVRLIRPVARGEWRGGKFTMGSLDKVIDEFRRRPPRPDARQPNVRIEDGRFVLTTDYGRADLRGGGFLADGKLIDLDAALQPTALKVGDLSAAIGEGRLALHTRGDRVTIAANLGAQSASLGQMSGQGVRIALTGEAPYPDLKARRGDGRLALMTRISADQFSAPDLSARAAVVDAAFDGQTEGWVDTLAVAGLVQAKATAASASTGDLTLTGAVFDGSGPVTFRAKDGASLRLAASARGRGAWSGLGTVLRNDDATMVAVKRLAGRFDFAAPGFSLALGEGVSVGLTRPLTLSGAGGASAVVSPVAGAPLFRDGSGALRLALRGGNLPAVDAVASRYRLTPSGFEAQVSGTVAGSLGPLQTAQLKTAGALVLRGEAISFAPSACTPLTLERLELGENDVEAISGALCPTGAAPLLTLNGGAWRVRARARDVAARAPFLEVRVTEGEGLVDLGGKGEAFQADLAIAGARVIDAAAVTRFHPVRLTGAVVSRGGDWTGDLAAADFAGHALASGHLQHAGVSGVGNLTFDTGVLTFAENGLQPAALSPMAVAVGAPATGKARFVGRVDWTATTNTGSGVLTLDNVGFKSAAGALSGLSGEVRFTSLDPLISAPGQALTVARIDSFVPLTDVKAAVGLDAKSVKLGGVSLAVAGGTLSLDPVVVPLDGSAWEGRLTVTGVQLSDLVEASPFADRVDVDARVSGVLPFTVTPERVRLIEGKLAADRPGRISIRREALSNLSAQGGEATTPELPAAPAVPAAAPTPANTVTDFAYQAMENLAFDSLDVTLNSLPEGRLGALFHIQGKFDPPKPQALYLSLVDLITKRFLERSLPLPSGTAVNLTLDSTLNLDQVLRDIVSARVSPASAGSPTIQP